MPSCWSSGATSAVLRRQIGRVRYQQADRLWLAALSRLIPRQRCGARLLDLAGRLAAEIIAE